MATMEAAVHHQQQPYPPLPASPTLTNPDMILPDERGSSSDEYEPLDDPNHAPMMMWKNAHAAASGATLPQMHVYFNGRTVGGPPAPHVQHHFGPTGPITPTTPIIYGNGTMLSDIGEVTEAESTLGKPASVSSRSKSSGRGSAVRKPLDSGSDAALRSSPTVPAEAIPKKRSKGNLIGGKQQRERRNSIESNSTITTQDQALFADFDDNVSIGDSVFQGDDEESVADSYFDGTAPQSRDQAGGLLHPANVGLKPRNLDAGGVGSGNEDRYSTYSSTSISRKAEQILANAKKRLTTMEGNLSRARSSLHSTSSYGSDGSTPSPPMIRATSVLYPRAAGTGSPQYSPGHARMSSDNALPQNSSVPTIYPQRSASALGAAGGYRQPISGPRSVEHLRDGFSGHYKRSNYTTDHVTLQPLSEDDVLPTPTATDTEISGQRDAKADALLGPTIGTSAERGLNRSTSVTQMRDLKDQMKDLKGKISSLREQARADSLKRRSLQSLRTPSPFTHARIDQWYAEPDQPGETEDASKDSKDSGRNPWNGELSSVDGEARELGKEEAGEATVEEVEEEESPVVAAVVDRAKRSSYIRHPVSQTVGSEVQTEGIVPEIGDASLEEEAELEDDKSDLETEDGDADEVNQPGAIPMAEGTGGLDTAEDGREEGAVYANDNEAAYESESGESFYHDTLQHPISHEDREDAFDYEHFFLHSAMGTISQQRLARRASRDSYSSEDSVETTRGPTSNTVDATSSNQDDITTPTTESHRSRRGSAASTSTFESFATADEEASNQSEKAAGGADDIDQAARDVTTANLKRSGSPPTARRTVLGPIMPNGHTESNTSLREALLRRPLSSTAINSHSLHRPSVSSFESTGTNRSFPLVNKPAQASNDDADGEARSEEDGVAPTDSDYESSQQQQNGHARSPSAASFDSVQHVGPAAMQQLAKDDQYLVERLVASLGKCVLGLTEAGRASTESRVYRRRIEAARKILEGLDV